MGALGPATASQRGDQPDYLSAFLQAGRRGGAAHDVRQERIGGDDDVCPRSQLGPEIPGPGVEEIVQRLQLPLAQHGKPGDRAPSVPVELRREPPDPPASRSQLARNSQGRQARPGTAPACQRRRTSFISILFILIAERYEHRTLGITSNLVFSEWERISDNPMATAAAIDRVVHHSVILEFDVPSYRTDAAQQPGQPEEVHRQR